MGHCVPSNADAATPAQPGVPVAGDGTASPGVTGSMQSGVGIAGTVAAVTAGTAAPVSGAAGTSVPGTAPSGASGPGSVGTAGTGTSGALPGTAGSGSAAEPCSMPSAFRCVSGGVGSREQCSNGAWAPAASCVQGEVCAGPETTTPGQCLAVAMVCANSKGARTCDGSGTLYQCDANGVIQMQTPCGSADLCMPGVRTGVCAMCAPGSRRCTGASLEVCSPTGDGWGSGQMCGSEALCDAKAGACKTAACMPGQQMCMGNDLYQCSPDQTGTQKVKSCGAGLCNSTRGDCNTCSPSAPARCEGTSVVTCSADGAMENRSACPMYCSAGKCVQCMEGATQACGSTVTNPPCSRGSQRCAGGVWGSCTPGVEPQKEIECNRVDEDCDGVIDDCDDTRLTCRSLVGGKTQCLPGGSYVNSCTSCVVADGYMKCLCSGMSSFVGPDISLNCRDIFQMDGMLVCAD
jgi:hypothetical protein